MTPSRRLCGSTQWPMRRLQCGCRSSLDDSDDTMAPAGRQAACLGPAGPETPPPESLAYCRLEYRRLGTIEFPADMASVITRRVTATYWHLMMDDMIQYHVSGTWGQETEWLIEHPPQHMPSPCPTQSVDWTMHTCIQHNPSTHAGYACASCTGATGGLAMGSRTVSTASGVAVEEAGVVADVVEGVGAAGDDDALAAAAAAAMRFPVRQAAT